METLCEIGQNWAVSSTLLKTYQRLRTYTACHRCHISHKCRAAEEYVCVFNMHMYGDEMLHVTQYIIVYLVQESRLGIKRYMVANPVRGQLDRDFFFFLSARSRLRIWSSEAGSAFPSRVSLPALRSG